MDKQNKGQTKSNVVSNIKNLLDISGKFDKIEGWLTYVEGLSLYFLARENKIGDIVEIGSFKGKSTCWLAQGIKDGNSKSKVYAIDPHTGSKEHKKGEINGVGGVFTGNTFSDFENNLTNHGLKKYVVPGVMTSREAFDIWSKKKSIGVLFIDGAHDYENVRSDFLTWSIYVPVGGVICIHDSVGWSGPKAVVNEFIIGNDKWNYFTIDSMLVAERIK